MMRNVISFAIAVAMCASASACNIPVFRYALERWRPDNMDVVVFLDGPLSDTHGTFIRQLQNSSFESQGSANLKVTLQPISEPMSDPVGLLWDQVSKQPDVSLPYVVVRSSIGGRQVNNWTSSMDRTMQAGLLESAIRRKLVHRLLSGDSAVWLVLKSHDQQRNTAAVELLNEQLQVLSKKIPLPEGIGLPGSELFSDIPLLMKFSVLEIDASDPTESYLVEQLKGFEPQALESGEPLIVPVFGRGRALEVIPATKVTAGLIEDLTLFLSGACSCQVKERNPGFDLLLAADWEQELFGEEAEELRPLMVSAGQPTTPKSLTIPPGHSPQPSIARTDHESDSLQRPDETKPATAAASLSWAILAVVSVVIFILTSHSLR